LEEVRVPSGRRGEAAAQPPQAIRADPRVVDEIGCGAKVAPGPDQCFRPDQVVLGREQERGVPRTGRLALWIVTAPGQAVIADLSDGALVPRPARLVLRLLVRTEDVIVSAGAGLVPLRRDQFRVRAITPVGPVAKALVRRVRLVAESDIPG